MSDFSQDYLTITATCSGWSTYTPTVYHLPVGLSLECSLPKVSGSCNCSRPLAVDSCTHKVIARSRLGYSVSLSVVLCKAGELWWKHFITEDQSFSRVGYWASNLELVWTCRETSDWCLLSPSHKPHPQQDENNFLWDWQAEEEGGEKVRGGFPECALATCENWALTEKLWGTRENLQTTALLVTREGMRSDGRGPQKH